MNLLGFQISRAPRNVNRIAGSNFAARSAMALAAEAAGQPARLTRQLAELPYVKATGELPVSFPTNRVVGKGLSGRAIPSTPISDFYWSVPQKLPPKQVESILRQGAAGSLWQQWQLNQRMKESWPIYRKCEMELRRAVSSARYVAHPFTLPGKRPTKSAQEKADFVNQNLASFRPDRFKDEDGARGMIFDICEAIMMGISAIELLWDEPTTRLFGRGEITVRASAWVNPRNYSFQTDGSFGLTNEGETGFMGFSQADRDKGSLFTNPHKFIVAKVKTKSGTALTAGLMRTLADIWTIIVYGRDYARLYMQKYGNPFLDLAYDSGITDQAQIDTFERLAVDAANTGWCVHPNNSEIKITQAHSMAGDQAQIAMMRLADEACQLLLLGQTLTTSVGSNGGNRALGEVHDSVRTEIIEYYAKWVATILTEQFAESLLTLNWGDAYLMNPERPTVEPDLTRPMSAVEQGTYLKDVSVSTVPVIAEPVYKRAGLEMPQPGDHVLIRGELVVMEEAMTPTEKREKLFDEQLDQQVSVNQAMGEPGQPGPPDGGQIEAALAVATEQDRAEFENLVSAAESAPYKNGEVVRVQRKLQQLLSKKRL